MQNNIYETFNQIFSDSPKEPKSIFLEISVIENVESTETNTSDIFELLLNMFVYGFNKLNLSYTKESVSILKQYFESVGFKFNIEIEQFDTILFKDLRYLQRYCSIDSSFSSFLSSNDNKPIFIMNANQSLHRNNLNQFIAIEISEDDEDGTSLDDDTATQLFIVVTALITLLSRAIIQE